MLKLKFIDNDSLPPRQRHFCPDNYYRYVLRLSDDEAASLAKAISAHKPGTDEYIIVDFIMHSWKIRPGVD